MPISLTHQDAFSIVSLDLPPLNLLDIDIMDELVDLHREADAHAQSRVIITRSNLPNIFSNGLNPKYVLSKDVPGRIDIFRAVGRMLSGLLSLGKPHITAINGPAMAGGAVLALPADFRFMHAERGRLSFSEPKVGLAIPEIIIKIIASFCNPAYLRDVVLMAKNMDAATTLKAGLADGIADSDEGLEEMVMKQAMRLARLSPSVLRATKHGLRRQLIEEAEAFAKDPGELATFVGDEFLGEGLRALLEQRPPKFAQ